MARRLANGAVKGRWGWVARPAEERFFERVDPQEDGCWVWSGARTLGGYGTFTLGGGGRWQLAHRWSYGFYVGPLVEGFEIDHLCCNPSCVNPDHLEQVTPQENQRRTQREKCQRGHPLDGLTHRSGGRVTRRCLACDAERSRQYRLARRMRDHDAECRAFSWFRLKDDE